MQALVLAGGAGTRLRSVLGDNLNKPMAPIAGKPFLEYLISGLQRQNVADIILAVGYKADLIQSYFGQGERWGVRLLYSREQDFLGTGGAVKLAEEHIRGDEVLVLNGDSFFDVDVGELTRLHEQASATATLALAHVENAARFGAVRVDATGRIVGFSEKETTARAGLINGGIYVLTREVLGMIPPAQVCSLEREVFPALIGRNLYGRPFRGFFIDIGVPADYERLQADRSPLYEADRERRKAPC
jgi:D-glycero-alpha-D-manno-heptose 1-phosphate guanylyltransferase